jgi:hypothetical protein
MTETPTPPLDGTFELALRQRHLQQLRNVDIPGPEGRIPGPPWPVLPGAPSPYDQLVQWSKQASKQIKRAVEQRQLHPPVRRNTESFCLLEATSG